MKQKFYFRLFPFLCALLFFTLACVPTPETEFVVNKGDGVLQQGIMAEPVDAKLDLPAHIALDAFEGVSTQIVIDADVIVPDRERFPVVEIAPQQIHADWARRVMEWLADGYPLLQADTEVPDTKEEIAEEIRGLQDALSEWESEQRGKVSETEWQEHEEELREELADWQAAYLHAPDAIEGAPNLSTELFRKQGRLYASIDFGKRNPAAVEVLYNGDTSLYNFDDTIGLPNAYADVPDDAILDGVSMTKAEAVQFALDRMEALGETGFEAVTVKAATHDPRDPSAGESEQSWYVILTRAADGVKTLHVNRQENLWKLNENKDYIEPCEQEEVTFCLRDSGVNYFEWTAPAVQIRTVNEGTALVPFETVLDTFRKLAALTPYRVIDETADAGTFTLTIDRIELGMHRVRKRNDTHTFLMVPAWAFYGTVRITDCDPSKTWLLHGWQFTPDADGQGYSSCTPDACFMVINAIDGSRIDQSAGY